MVEAPAIFILGTRGVPAGHGGFETFAERFALHMQGQGWQVTVYCQADEGQAGPVVDEWRGIRRVTFKAGSGATGTMHFDWQCVRHAMRETGVMLVLGYNTAIFSALLRLVGLPVLTNMDGIEWKRAKWPWHGRVWLYLNEWIAAVTSNKLIADHPEIARHHSRHRKSSDIVMIPYGADLIETMPTDAIESMGLEPGGYLLSIGRIEPENNIVQMIRAYARKDRPYKFVCLGRLEPEKNPYHAEVIAAAEGKVLFAGAIYEQDRVKALRFHAAAYCHGHSVGGTNPSLVEALGAGSAVVAHDNVYNRWVAGPAQLYFRDADDLAVMLDNDLVDPDRMARARLGSRSQFVERFKWIDILKAYQAEVQAAWDRYKKKQR